MRILLLTALIFIAANANAQCGPTSITVDPQPILVCDGSSDVVNFTTTGTCAGSYEYEVQDGVGVVQAWSTTASFNASPTTTTNYTVNVRCTSCPATVISAPFTIDVIEEPTVSGTLTLCPGEFTTLTASNSNGTLSWWDAASGGTQLSGTDTYTTPALNSSTTYYVHATGSIAGVGGSILITECGLDGANGGTGSEDYIEISNLYSTPVNTAGWVVAVSNSYSNINTYNTTMWNLPASFPPCSVVTRTDYSGSSNYWGNNIFWNSTSPSWAIVIDNVGNVVDFIAWGWTAAQLATFNPTINGFPITLGAEWIGNGCPLPCGSAGGVQYSFARTGSADNNVAGDFVCQPTSVDLVNPGLSCGWTAGVTCPYPVTVTVAPTCTCLFDQYTATVSQCENGNSFTVSGDFSYLENPGTGSLVVEVTNGSGTYTQTFNPPFTDGVLNNYSISGITSDGSPLTVDFYFTDDLACTAQLTDVSPVLPTLSNVLGGGVYCPGDVISDITVDVTGNGPFSVDYTLDGVAQNATGAGPTINLGNAVGDYIITAVNDLGCTNSAAGNESIVLNALPTVLSMTGGDSYCDNDPINDIVLDLSGTGPWTVNYTIDGVAQTVNSTVSPMNLGTTEGVYQLVNITDANCNDAANDTDEIIIEPAPTVYAGADFINCENDPIILTGSGATSYTWDNNVTNGSAFVPNVTTTYTVIGTDANGCQDTDDITVTVEPLPAVEFMADHTSGCEPFPVLFTNTTPGNMVDCQWNFGDGSTGTGCNSIANIYSNGGLYDVTLTTTSSNGCINSVTYDDYIYVENIPQPGFIPSTQQVLSLDTEVAFNNVSTGAVNYVWDFGDNSALSYDENPVHEFPGDQTSGYTVTLYAYSPLGCVDSTTTVIQVNEEVIFYLPNTFTPDGDEFNQGFQPVFTAGYDPFDFDMYIFNRWGEIIWESHDASVAWDGTYNGKPVQEGTYTWKIEFKTIATDERMTVNGHVTLIR